MERKFKVSYTRDGYVWPRIITAADKADAIQKANLPANAENITVREIHENLPTQTRNH